MHKVPKLALYYLIYINDIITKGESVDGNRGMQVLLYADDIVIIFKSKINMRRAHKCAEEHSIKNNYKFNIKNCKLICRYRSYLCLYRQRLDVVEEFTYLGIVFNIKGLILKTKLKITTLVRGTHCLAFKNL
jgi:hypothetical protein